MRASRRLVKLFLATCTAFVLLVAVTIYCLEPSKQHKIEVALVYGRLGPLPASARDIKVATVGNLFSRNFWLRFKADASDIELFLESSEGVRNVKPLLFKTADERRVGLGLGLEVGTNSVGFQGRFLWFRPDAVTHGRLYEIPWDAKGLHGRVTVDDDTGTVYVETGHS